jgi:hypothetical protein
MNARNASSPTASTPEEDRLMRRYLRLTALLLRAGQASGAALARDRYLRAHHFQGRFHRFLAAAMRAQAEFSATLRNRHREAVRREMGLPAAGPSTFAVGPAFSEHGRKS